MSARTRPRANRLIDALASLPEWPRLPRWVLIIIGFLFVSHLLLFAVGANWWNDPAFLPTSPAGGR